MTGARAAIPLVASMCLLSAATRAAAQGWATPTVEAGYAEARLSAGYPAWRQAHGRIIASAGAIIYQLDGLQRAAFGGAGSYANASATHTFNADWYGALNAGVGSGSFLFPRASGGVMVARKWLDARTLVTTAAINFYAQTDSHRDVLWTGTLLYYTPRPAVWQAGFNIARSNPGSVTGYSPFVVAQLGDPRRHTVTARISAGREAYARLGRDAAIVAFGSHHLSLGWRAVVARDVGYVVEGEHYGTALYSRTGLKVGAFWGPAR